MLVGGDTSNGDKYYYYYSSSRSAAQTGRFGRRKPADDAQRLAEETPVGS